VRVRRAVAEADLDRDRAGALVRDATFALAAQHVEPVALGRREVDVDRIGLHDLGEHGVLPRLADQVADVHLRAADAARDRRRDVRVGELELGRAHGGLRRRDLGAAAIALGAPLIELRAGEHVLVGELLRARELALRHVRRRLRTRERALRLGERHLEGARVDAEEHLARGDGVAVLEELLLQVAAHARADCDAIHRLDVADVLAAIGHRAEPRRRDAYFRRGRSVRRVAAPASEQGSERDEQRCAADRSSRHRSTPGVARPRMRAPSHSDAPCTIT